MKSIRPVLKHGKKTSRASGRKSNFGFTLPEMILAIVVTGIGLAGVLAAFHTAAKAGADPMERKQLLSAAEELLDEALNRPFAAGPGTIVGCDRTGADDIADYDGYSQPVCDLEGNPIPGLAGYSLAVSSTAQTVSGIAMVRVDVTAAKGSASITISGWRADYAS